MVLYFCINYITIKMERGIKYAKSFNKKCKSVTF